jgi:hypothetical protein
MPINGGMYDTHLHIGVVRDIVDEQGPDGKWRARFRADLFDTEAGREAHEYLRAISATSSETGVSIGMMGVPPSGRATIDGKHCEQYRDVALREISITSVSAVPGTHVTAVRAEVPDGIDRREYVPAEEAALIAGPPNAPPIPVRFDVGINYFPLLDGLVAHLGAPAVRAHLSTILSDATIADSDAASGAPASADSNATTTDSQGASRDGSEPSAPNTVPMEERLAFLRAQFIKANPQ